MIMAEKKDKDKSVYHRENRENGKYISWKDIFIDERVKPIFPSKMDLRWVPNANEIDTNNMKCTCPTQGSNALRFMLGVMQMLAFALGVMQILAFLDTNMLVSPTQNSHVRGIAQRECFHVAVEYRLYSLLKKNNTGEFSC